MAYFLTPECYYDYASRLYATGGRGRIQKITRKAEKKGAQDGGGSVPRQALPGPLVSRGEAECIPPPYIMLE